MAKVRILYSSGQTVDLECEEFELSYNRGNELTGVRWVAPNPKPMYLGIGSIIAVFQLDPEYTEE